MIIKNNFECFGYSDINLKKFSYNIEKEFKVGNVVNIFSTIVSVKIVPSFTEKLMVFLRGDVYSDKGINLEFSTGNNDEFNIKIDGATIINGNLECLVYVPINVSDIFVEAMSGNISINNISTKNIFAKSMSGNIYLKTIEADSLKCKVSSGNVVFLETANIPEINIDLKSGNVRFESEILCDMNLFCKNLSGNVNINCKNVKDIKANISTKIGNVKNKFSPNGKNIISGVISTSCGNISIS